MVYVKENERYNVGTNSGYFITDKRYIPRNHLLNDGDDERIEKLEKENRALRELIQVYLSRLDTPKGLPKPRKSFLERLKEFLSLRKKK